MKAIRLNALIILDMFYCYVSIQLHFQTSKVQAFTFRTEGYEKLLSMLSSCETAARKSMESQRANERQIEEYDAAYADIGMYECSIYLFNFNLFQLFIF